MRNLVWIGLAGSLGFIAGCGEFVSTGQRATAIDVVGDPADPTPDSMDQGDILGSGFSPLAEFDSVTDLTDEPLVPKPFPDDLADGTGLSDEPDMDGSIGTATPVSLKKAIPDPKPVE
jgi:hypothetical protein